jgi:methyltransferase (TIGR00027 family)
MKRRVGARERCPARLFGPVVSYDQGVDSVGATSRLTAAARARESARADRLFEDVWAAELAGEEGFSLLEGNDASLHGQAPPAFVVRHRFFDDFLTRQTSHGVRQVVVIAAGLDTRAFRLSWPAGVHLFELDQPAVLSFKQDVLDNVGAAASCHRHVVPVDLRDDWPSALTDAGYRRAERVAWLAEGLLFYLPEATVTALLGSMAALSIEGSTLGTDTMSAATLGHESRQDWVSYYASVGAPFIFGTDHPSELLARHGWRPTLHPYPDVAHQYGRSWPSPALPGPKSTLVTATRVPAAQT